MQASKWTKWSGGLVIGASAIALLQTAAVAQFAPSEPVNEAGRAGDRETFSGGSSINSVLDLIHQSNFSRDRAPNEIEEDRRNNIRNAADDFLMQRQQRLQETNPPTESTATPAPATP